MQLAGLRSDQLAISKEPQFQSKKRVPFSPPRVSNSLRWTDSKAPQRPRSTARPPACPALVEPQTDSSGNVATPFAPRESSVAKASCITQHQENSSSTANVPGPSTEQQKQKPCPSSNGITHVLRKKAGLKSERQNAGHQYSEYQRQFQWKSSTAESPLLTAQQMWHSNNESIPPFKSNSVVMESEYKKSFKGSPPPRPLRLRRDVELNEVPPCQRQTMSPKESRRKKKRQTETNRKMSLKEQSVHPDSEQLQQESQNHAPPKPVRKMKTEYSSNFRSLYYSYRDGAWISSRTVGKEMQELREKADAYRKRAWGTHFSRHHLSQILSEQNYLWEASDCSSLSTFTDEDTRSPSIPIIEALDLARVNSGDRSHSSGASVSMNSEGNSGRGLSKMPTRPAQRKSAWDEGKDSNERDKADVKQQSEEVPIPQLKKTDDNEATVGCSKEIKDVATSSPEEGRLPTPKLKSMLAAQRTHHHRTTPATGGAILVSPPRMKNTITARRSEAPLGKAHTPYRHLSQVTPPLTHSRDENENISRPSLAAGLPTVDPLPLEEELLNEDSPTVLTTKPARKPNKQVIRAWLRDCTPSHANRIQGTLRNAEFQHNGNLGLSRPDHFVSTSSDCGVSDNDDKMSQISSWSAASCSMASQVLDRAQKRKNYFWGKT